jgi:Cys-tRNA(Pro)/Cys-tRNA(Cys) deacylase
MARATRATQTLDRAKIAYQVVSYDYAPGQNRVGLQAAEALGVDPQCVVKTLMAQVDGKPVCALLSSSAEVSMKLLAAAAGGKSAAMMSPKDAERVTGYRVGGISPFGQLRKVPIFIDRQALDHAHIYINGGQRGLQFLVQPADAVAALGAVVADLRNNVKDHPPK